MISLLAIRRDQRASSAAEFALVLPAFLFLLLGTIDVGRYMWNVGQVEKATMMGTRYAVVTDMVPSDLYTYSFAISGGVPQGTVVPQTSFSAITCSSANGAVACACPAGAPCAFGTTANQTAFLRIVDRMRSFYGGISPDNVVVNYSWSGLGYSGDPNGSDVDPIVTVFLKDLPFKPLITGTMGNLGLPGTSHSLTMEDGEGFRGN
ncbi:TadE/TadG family type IV pilus assembly protein [Aurantiacibacter marinus]|uniref:Pilus assembly protein TadE n=1 Tax=Aurantiacibacter marinus TaxID=874156 RepID=A0A0H0XQY9_9SPHN|nr:TadE/TadG family type IV pilus assembly protein [Aurantiacibacter marinus]KLI64401.1 pilus assembly protein TadE [Aurantiacibacter marinus]